jgi:tRNA A-37 threonylcarbamoyl transferase component Bud32
LAEVRFVSSGWRLKEEIAAVSWKKTAASHLSAELLQAFEYGTLPEEQIPAVEAHLQSCAACCDALAALPEDGFLTRLRRACDNAPTLQGQSFTPPPRSTLLSPPPVDSSSDSQAPSLPGYDNLRELGSGGMGVVYAATHAVMGRRVAVKVIHPHLCGSPAATERFRREVRAAARLAHPHIVTAYDAGQAGGRPFLVMEYVEGESLGDRLERLGPLSVAEACAAVRQAALGVQHAHDHGLIHRDLKPHNLMCAAGGTVKVCDFGLAALADDRPALPAGTAANALMGTPDYMAPEQAEDARAADGRADVYALGCTLYHLLTGQAPFPEESVVLKLVSHRTRERPQARRVRPDLPAELEGVLRRAMARRPADRYQTPAELAEALAFFCNSARLAVSDTGAGSSLPAARLKRFLPSRRRLMGAAVLVLAGSVFAGVARMWPSLRDAAHEPDDADRGKGTPQEPVHVMRFEVKLTRNVRGGGLPAGCIGEDVFDPHLDDTVTVAAWLTRPAYAFVIAFRPDGTPQVCFPVEDDDRPPLTDRPSYPFPLANANEYGLNDGTGLEAFAVVVSHERLPPFAEWWRRCRGCPWKKEEAPAGIVYRGNGEDAVEARTAVGEARGKDVYVKGKTPVGQLALWLRKRPGITTVQVLGFAVEPKEQR